jgi:hypothetical protein
MEPFDDQTRMIRAIFAETQDSSHGAWADFLSLLRQVTQADGASLVLDLPRKTRSWFDGSPDNGDPSTRQTLRFDRVYSHENLPASKEGGALTRTIKVRATNGASLTLSITRGTHDRDFRSTDGQMLHNLAPFLGQAMGLWLDRQRERADARISGAMLAALGGGWLVLDTTGKVKRSSVDMATDFQAAEGLPLTFGEPAISSAFTEAFAKAVAGEEPVAFSLDQGEMLLTQIEYESAPAVLGRLRTTPKCALISAPAVAHHFGVSTSEARLAILICDGHSLKAAAAMLGWTEESTRTCSKSLFARIGVSGQPDLVRRILNSSIWYKASR